MICNYTINKLQLQPHSVVLDIGCGFGLTISELIKQLGSKGKIIGVDLHIQYTKKNLSATLEKKSPGRPDVELIGGSAEELSKYVPPNSVDAVICEQVLQYVDNPSKVFEGIRSVLKPGGQLVLSCFIGPITQQPHLYPLYNLLLNDSQVVEADKKWMSIPYSYRDGAERLQDLVKEAGLIVTQFNIVPVVFTYQYFTEMVARHLPHSFQSLSRETMTQILMRLEFGMEENCSFLKSPEGGITSVSYAYYLVASRPISSL